MSFTHVALLAIASLALPASAATTVWLTQKQSETASTFPDDVVVHIIDKAGRLEEEFFAPVSRATSPQAAQQAAHQLFRSPDWPLKEQQLKRAWETVARANQLGIGKTPAVVIDERLVIYGTTDVHHAHRLAAQHRPGGEQ